LIFVFVMPETSVSTARPLQRLASPPNPSPCDEDVRIGPLRPMAGVLCAMGHDPAALLLAGGLEATAFDDPERRIPFRAAADLVRRGALLTGREDFGLLVGEHFAFDDFGLLGQLMWRARRVGEALQDLNRFIHLQDRGSVTFLRPAKEGLVSLGYSILDPDTPGAGLIYDLVLALGMRLMHGLAGPRFRAAEVCLPHVAPRLKGPYRRVFGAPLSFDAPRAEIQFAADWLQAPVIGADAVQRDLVQRAARLADAGASPGLAGRTRAAVRVLLMSGNVSAARVAGAMGLHERTLRRRLTAEGESLQHMVAQARFEVARQLLRETRLGLQDIADALGYAEAAVFVRAFRGWAGCTPGQWRAAQLNRPASP
jgi:AraC-like DNA-binding protein